MCYFQIATAHILILYSNKLRTSSCSAFFITDFGEGYVCIRVLTCNSYYMVTGTLFKGPYT